MPFKDRHSVADVSAFLFDVDGTLIDSNAAHAETWTQALREHGIACDVADVRPLVGTGGDKLLARIAHLEEDSPDGRSIGQRRRRSSPNDCRTCCPRQALAPSWPISTG